MDAERPAFSAQDDRRGTNEFLVADSFSPEELSSAFNVVPGDFGMQMDRLTPGAKARVAKLCAEHLPGLIDDVRHQTVPKEEAVRGHLVVWRLSRVLFEFDPALHRKEAGRRMEQLLAHTLAVIERSASRSLEDGRLAADYLYRLLPLQAGEEAVGLCRAALERIDRRMQQWPQNQVIDHGRQWRRDSQETFLPTQAREDGVDAVRQLVPEGDARKTFEAWVMTTGIRAGADGYPVVNVQKGGAVTRWRMEVHPIGTADDPHLTFRSLGGGAMVTVMLSEFLERLAKDAAGVLPGLTQQAETNEKREQEGGKQLSAFDLPHEGGIAHLRVFPRQYDEVMASNLQTSMLLTGALRARYGERMRSMPLILEQNPRQALREQVAEAHAEGTRCFVIDLFSHGDDQEGLTGYRPPLTANDLVVLANEFPDAQFQISSMACFGGGLREGFLRSLPREELRTAFEGGETTQRRPLRERMNVFLQSRPNALNATLFRLRSETAAERAGPAKPQEEKKEDETTVGENYSTHYYLAFIEALHQGKTYGEAVRIATEDTRRRTMMHPESILRGALVLGPARIEQQRA